ncbi:aspartic peptidase A1 [Pholiota conissans]|uniref:Aspartic peptidase A1 n=1 Tax=Pholiota conissans TaxID=109636 RepID=A0A9P5ZE76_9AGAR|nr:aspartic peptidase A1 [Pholiota conissans]
MKLSLPLSLTLGAALASAHRVSFKKIKQPRQFQRRGLDSPSDLQTNVLVDSNNNSTFDLNTVHDLIYLANITVAGVDYPVQLDTGSSDLFIKADTTPIPNVNETTISYNLTYAIGWASGHVAYAPVEFVGISVPSQAFLDADKVNNPAIGYGAQGIAGLGFTRLSSIDLVINSTSSSAGRSLLFNLFAANPQEQNFIAFSLQRTLDDDASDTDEVEGTFAIGELEPQYAAIAGNEHIPTWPINNPYRWNLLLDALIVNDSITVPTTKVVGAPSNKAVILMDSGSSYTYAPVDICKAIYGNVPGASYDASLGYWRVPCSAEIDMALQIGGQVFPIHPLDVNPSTAIDHTLCIGSFVPSSFSIGNDFDWLVGDNFLRSVYSVYDFGDFDASGEMGNPYMKLLSIIDADEASADFHKARGGTPRTNITYTGLNGISVAPSFSISTDISESLEMIGKFIPAMLGIVALNALILIVCCIVWLVSFVRKRRLRPTARTPRARMSPMPPVDIRLERGDSDESGMGPMPMNLRNSYIAGSSPGNHTYEPVSMALTEDTFVPPSPAFHGFDRKGLLPGDRPKSVA